MRYSLATGGLAAFLLAALPGCGAGDGLALTDVSGTVTLDGKPVPGATVMFIPQGPEGSPSSGVTDASGQYTLHFSRDREGVLPGKQDVTIATEKIPESDVAVMRERGEDVYEFVPVPAKYSQPGNLVREVKPEGGTIDLELTSDDAG